MLLDVTTRSMVFMTGILSLLVGLFVSVGILVSLEPVDPAVYIAVVMFGGNFVYCMRVTFKP